MSHSKVNENNYLKEVGKRLMKCRNRNFISRQELAKRANISVHSIIKMEKGEEAIGIEDAVKICEYLGYSVEFILTGKCGFREFVRMNQKILQFPDIYSDNLQKVATAFWANCPRYYK